MGPIHFSETEVTIYQRTLGKISKSKYFIYAVGQTSYQIRQTGREIPISLNCKQCDDLYYQRSQNTCVI